MDDQGNESLNFQISLMIYLILLLIVFGAGVLLPMVGIGSEPYGLQLILFIASIRLVYLLALALFLFDFVEVILASLRTSEGVTYRYPLRIRFLR